MSRTRRRHFVLLLRESRAPGLLQPYDLRRGPALPGPTTSYRPYDLLPGSPPADRSYDLRPGTGRDRPRTTGPRPPPLGPIRPRTPAGTVIP
ncbi:hypothetical protein GCM10010498_50410 [Streptomyces cavourensis]|nr:hypothetical protein GCM10010498_50410 [Streptomyces cavourensis]